MLIKYTICLRGLIYRYDDNIVLISSVEHFFLLLIIFFHFHFELNISTCLWAKEAVPDDKCLNYKRTCTIYKVYTHVHVAYNILISNIINDKCIGTGNQRLYKY